ncbi:cation:proton antiporter [Marinobacter salexigens]|uniref:cation:proton antiporter n=1 Tax=Marinobacter salexigens TaxID=1925763 RepID=UPI001374760A|nr:cation:proton antiporter [Marinobacter salexigens]
MEILLIGLLMISGLTLGALGSALFNVPRVVGYILAGMLFAPDFLGGLLGAATTEWTRPVVAVTLGVIAYLIGGAVTASQLRQLGWTIVTATLGKVSGSFVAVLVGFTLLGTTVADVPGWTFTLLLAAIATTTAPAAIVAIIHQYRARGPLTTALLGMVALDDMLALVIFSLVLAAIDSAGFTSAIPAVIWEIIAAIGFGAAGAYAIERAARYLPEQELKLVALLGGIILLTGLAETWHFSPLLAAMTLGFSVRMFAGAHSEPLFRPLEQLQEVVFVLFFTLAGLHFAPAVVLSHAGLIVLYFLLRAGGQIIGAMVGARLAGAPRVISHNVGLIMLPQGGVAIGMALMLTSVPSLGDSALLIVNIVTATTLLTETLGAMATRFGLARAGELSQSAEASEKSKEAT